MGIEHKSNLQTISPAKAEKLLKFNTYEGQRPARESRVEEYEAKIKDGRFHVGSVALVHSNGDTLLMDGQKQLMAAILAGKEIRATVQEFTLTGKDIGNGHTIASIFAQFNVDDVRTRGDIANAKAVGMGWADWNNTLIRNLAAALDMVDCPEALAHMNHREHNVTRDQTGDKFVGNEKVCEWIHSIFDGHKAKDTKHMLRVPVLTAMIATFRKGQGDATRFWTAVRDGENLLRKSGPFALREFLKSASLYSGSNNVQQRIVVDRRAIYAKCLHAWNAWRDGRETGLRYLPAAPLPKAT
jgi:hypothetical protein